MIATLVVIKGEAVAVVVETPAMVEDSFNATIMIYRITYLIVVVVGSTDNQKGSGYVKQLYYWFCIYNNCYYFNCSCNIFSNSLYSMG